MNPATLQRAVQYAAEALARRQQAGEIPAFISLEGHLTLLSDRIRRWFKEGRNEREVVDLAVDGILALSMVLPPELDVDAIVAKLAAEAP